MRFATARKICAGEKDLQDRAEIFSRGSNLVLVVADGAGGLSGGAEAAQFLVNGIKKGIDATNCEAAKLVDLLTLLDEEMAAKGSGGETTGVVAVLSEAKIVGASVGDSGALFFSSTGVADLTAKQVRKPLLGSGRAVPTGFSGNCAAGTLVVASDGLLKYTSPEKIAATITASGFDEVANKLVDLVRFPSGGLPDDVSVLLARKI